MRIIAILAAAAITTATVNAQNQAPGAASEKVTSQGVPTDIPHASAVDMREWEWANKHAEVTPKETRFFRTFRKGKLTETARIEYWGEGSQLAGFEMNVVEDARSIVINSIRPVYLNAGRRFTGRLLGSTKGKLVRLIAKDGYAVSAMDISVGQTITGLRVTFARIKADGLLNVQDTYPADVGSAMDPGPGDGIPYCGLYLSPGDDNSPITCVALLVSQKLVRDFAPKFIPQRKKVWTPPPSAEDLAKPLPDAADPQIAEIIKGAAERVVTVTTPTGRATAFVCRMDDKPWLVLNQQTIAGAAKIQFASQAKGVLQVGEGRAAADQDLAAFAMPAEAAAYETLPDLEKNIQSGDPVVAFCSTQAGPVQPWISRIRRFEPKLLELDGTPGAEYHGAPIIHLKTGRAIGIVRWAVQRSFNAHNDVASHKWHFDRLDSIKTWEPLQWAAYQADATAIGEAISLTAALKAVYDGVSKRALPRQGFDPRLRTAFSLLPAPNATLPTPEQRARVLTAFPQELTRISKAHFDAWNQKARYSYFKRFLAQEDQVQKSFLFYINERRDLLIPPPPAKPASQPKR